MARAEWPCSRRCARRGGPSRRGEPARPAVAQEAYVLDVFTRRVAEVEAFRSRARDRGAIPVLGSGYEEL